MQGGGVTDSNRQYAAADKLQQFNGNRTAFADPRQDPRSASQPDLNQREAALMPGGAIQHSQVSPVGGNMSDKYGMMPSSSTPSFSEMNTGVAGGVQRPRSEELERQKVGCMSK